MNSGNPFLDQLFNNLSSVYPTDNGMLNSNLFIYFQALANEFTNIQNQISGTYNNTYLALADTSALEANFSPFVGFPFPPELNTVTDGGNIYRAILISLYNAFLNGSTDESMYTALTTLLSFLTIDISTEPVISQSDSVFFNTFDNSIQLAYGALSSSGTTAQPSDITIFPSGLTVTAYNNSTNVISFSGDIPSSGQSYVIEYFRDHTSQINTNWVNFTTQNVFNPLPSNLKVMANTFQNPEFSYWWNTFNLTGSGVQILDGGLNLSQQGLVWRLPEKFIEFTSPYNGLTQQATIELYNYQGQIYDINSPDKANNPDYPQSDTINSYVDQVSGNPNNYYIRYSQNNALFVPLEKFAGNVLQDQTVSNLFVNFISNNFGTLDFFEMGPNFDINDIFGFGTKNVWLNVTNQNGLYTLSNTFLFVRSFSLHENILFSEIFENGQLSLNRIETVSGTAILAEFVGVPLLQGSEDCLQLIGGNASVYPIIASGTLVSGNRFQVDLFDALNSGTQTTVQFNIIDPLNQNVYGNTIFRFGIDKSILAPLFIAGPISGTQIENTIPYGFIDTYFQSVDETSYSIISNAGSYNLASGNPNIQSNFSLVSSGTSFSFSPNLSGNSLINTNDVFIEFNNNNTSASTLSLSIGTRVGDLFLEQSIMLNTGSPFYQWEVGYTYMSGNTIIAGGGTGGLTTIPIISGTNTIELIAGQNMKINGASYAGAGNIIYNPNYLQPTPFYESFGESQAITAIVGSGLVTNNFSVANTTTKTQYGYSAELPYFYQLAPSGQIIDNASKIYMGNLPRELGWHRFIFDLGSGLNNITSSLDNYQFLNTPLTYSGSFGFAGDLNDSSSITLNQNSIFSDHEFSYFGNVQFSYYTPTETRPEYNYLEDPIQDWQGSYLDQSAILSSRSFAGAGQPNFTFELVVLGLLPQFVSILTNLANKLKPCHTLMELEVTTDYELNTTSIIPENVGNPENWETGNVQNSIIVTEDLDTADNLDLPGAITITPS